MMWPLLVRFECGKVGQVGQERESQWGQCILSGWRLKRCFLLRGQEIRHQELGLQYVGRVGEEISQLKPLDQRQMTRRVVLHSVSLAADWLDSNFLLDVLLRLRDVVWQKELG